MHLYALLKDNSSFVPSNKDLVEKNIEFLTREPEL